MALIFFCLLSVFPAAAEFASNAEIVGRTPSDLVVERVTIKSLLAASEHVEGELDDASTLIFKAVERLKEKIQRTGQGKPLAGEPPMALFTNISSKSFAADVLVPLEQMPPSPGEVGAIQSPEGKALRVVHKGPLEKIEDTYLELQTFVEDGDFETAERMIERYPTDPAKTDPKDMITEIYVLLK